MKKYFVMCLCMLALLLCLGGAMAETVEPELGVVTPIASGAQTDLDGDGVLDTVVYEVSNDDQNDQIPYVKLTINGQETIQQGWYMHDELYLLKLNEYGPTFLLVFDFGPSDDPDTMFYYLDAQGSLASAGHIYADPRTMTVEGKIITAQDVRGNLLYTWYHAADYMMAFSVLEDAPAYNVVNLPRSFYGMGLTVKAMQDIPLQKSPINEEITYTVQADDLIVLAGTDDVEWLYLTTLDGFEGGWLRMLDGMDVLMNNGRVVPGYELFEGLFLAD